MSSKAPAVPPAARRLDVGITEDDIADAERHAAAAVAGCEICTAKNIDRTFQEHFGVAVCWPCKDADVTDNYKLIAKTTARTDFLITDKELESLGYLEKPNPRAHLGGGPMKLYMRRQVLELVLKRFGTMEALQEERLTRSVKRFEGGGTRKGANSKKRRLDVSDAAVLPRSASAPAASHKHSYTKGAEVLIDEETCLWERSCTDCGMTVQFEKLL